MSSRDFVNMTNGGSQRDSSADLFQAGSGGDRDGQDMIDLTAGVEKKDNEDRDSEDQDKITGVTGPSMKVRHRTCYS